MSDNGVRQPGKQGTAERLTAASARYVERQQLNAGFGNSMSRAFELALTPTIMAGVGWLLDRWLGTAPIFLVSLAVFTFVYTVWKMAKGYDVAMREQEAELARRTRGRPA